MENESKQNINNINENISKNESIKDNDKEIDKNKEPEIKQEDIKPNQNIILEKKSKILCPFCYEKNISSNSEDFKPETPIKCSKCSKKFYFFKCFHCNNKIYYKQNFDFTNFIIKCPYSKCQKIFAITSCPKCTTKIFFNGRYPVKCPNQNCNNIFTKIKCPYKDCEKFGITNSKTYKEGDIILCEFHDPKFFFQTLNCYHCSRSIIWIFPHKCLIGGQNIKCPYEDCGKFFNLLNCPSCNKINFFSNSNEDSFGENMININIKCINCSNEYVNLFCPICLKNFTIGNDYIEGNILQCPYALNKNKNKNFIDIPHDDKYFQIVNCIFCKRPNIFMDSDKYPYYHGQKVLCQYQDCQKIFCKIPCPFCMKFNLFPKAEFSFGSKISCVFENCKKSFRVFLCPNCNNYQVETKDMLEGQNIKCLKCGVFFFSIYCPHCKNNILGKNTKLLFGQSILCPYKNCQRLFSYLYCCKCKKPLYDKNNAYNDEMIINCPYKNCGVKFINCICPKCLRNNFTIIKMDNNYNQENNIRFTDSMECIHCGNKFLPTKRYNIFNEGIIIEFRQGKTIFFNDGIKDPLQMIKSKMIIESEIYKLIEDENCGNFKISQLGQTLSNLTIMEQVIKKDERMQCCFCLENISESVFIPCGHRCVCFKCGEMIMKSQNKKCPICQEEAFYLLKKVYDV